jgi:hypothetical protein
MTNDLTIIERVQQQHLSIAERAGQMDVYDADSADRAGRMLVEVRGTLKAIEEARFQITRPLDEAKSRAMEQQKNAQQPFLDAEQHLKGIITSYEVSERNRIRAEAAEAEAEQARLEVAAQNAAERGEYDEAQQLQQQRDATGSVEKVHRAAGTQMRYTWKAEVTDLDALVKAVASNTMLPSNLLQVNQPALNALAKALGGKGKVPGVRFYEEANLAATSR